MQDYGLIATRTRRMLKGPRQRTLCGLARQVPRLERVLGGSFGNRHRQRGHSA